MVKDRMFPLCMKGHGRASRQRRPTHPSLISRSATRPLVNLIPYNPAAGLPYRTPSPAVTARFVEILTQGGLNVNIRYRKGERIDAACGQLRRGDRLCRLNLGVQKKSAAAAGPNSRGPAVPALAQITSTWRGFLPFFLRPPRQPIIIPSPFGRGLG